MPIHAEIISVLEQQAPLAYQEPWDNSGWQVGDPNANCTGVLVAVEATEATLIEAQERGCNLLITHHPLLFKPLNRVGVKRYQERVVCQAIKQDIAIYAAHTNLDNAPLGINYALAQRLELQDCTPLVPQQGGLYLLSVMVPKANARSVKNALWEAGAGQQGNYEHCAYSIEGMGEFTPIGGAKPTLGHINIHQETEEVSLSFLVESRLKASVEKALKLSHPYEEPAYQFIPLANQHRYVGTGIIGNLPLPLSWETLLNRVKAWPGVEQIAYSQPLEKPIYRVAICGGSGSSFLSQAIAQGADIYITGEAKYNDFLDAQGLLQLITIGHHESETVARERIKGIISQIFSTFDVQESIKDINPVKYTH